MNFLLLAAKTSSFTLIFCIGIIASTHCFGSGLDSNNYTLDDNIASIDSIDCPCPEPVPVFTVGEHIVDEGESNYCITLDVTNFVDVSSFVFILSCFEMFMVSFNKTKICRLY